MKDDKKDEKHAKPPRKGALIVAAGLALRMQAFKPMLPLGKSTLICTAISCLQMAGVKKIVLVCGHRAEELRAHVAHLEVETLFNPDYASSDMFRSLSIGLMHLQAQVDQLFFLPGDVPMFAPETLALMEQEMAKSGARVVVPAHGGRKGHPVLINTRVIPFILAYQGDMGLKGALASLTSCIQVLEVSDPGILMDVDHPQDYQALLHYASRQTRG